MNDAPLKKCPKCHKAASSAWSGRRGLDLQGDRLLHQDYKNKPAAKEGRGQAAPEKNRRACRRRQIEFHHEQKMDRALLRPSFVEVILAPS